MTTALDRNDPVRTPHSGRARRRRLDLKLHPAADLPAGTDLARRGRPGRHRPRPPRALGPARGPVLQHRQPAWPPAATSAIRASAADRGPHRALRGPRRGRPHAGTRTAPRARCCRSTCSLLRHQSPRARARRRGAGPRRPRLRAHLPTAAAAAAGARSPEARPAARAGQRLAPAPPAGSPEADPRFLLESGSPANFGSSSSILAHAARRGTTLTMAAALLRGRHRDHGRRARPSTRTTLAAVDRGRSRVREHRGGRASSSSHRASTTINHPEEHEHRRGTDHQRPRGGPRAARTSHRQHRGDGPGRVAVRRHRTRSRHGQIDRAHRGTEVIVARPASRAPWPEALRRLLALTSSMSSSRREIAPTGAIRPST